MVATVRLSLAFAGWQLSPQLVAHTTVPCRADKKGKVENHGDWRDACAEWIATHAQPGAKFLTPRTARTLFKWYAAHSEVATWKDLPQDALALSPRASGLRTCMARGMPKNPGTIAWPRRRTIEY